MFKISVFSAVTALTLVAVSPLVSFAADDGVTNLPSATLAWEKTEEGVAFAPLVGDRFREPYMAMVRLPAGLTSPAHTKTANMYGVVVSGTMTHGAVGTKPAMEVALSEGSFYKIPKNLPHISKCVSDVDCVTFLYQDGKFDFLPVSK
jgi:quercetin dioxygenase-like cupin family protein